MTGGLTGGILCYTMRRTQCRAGACPRRPVSGTGAIPLHAQAGHCYETTAAPLTCHSERAAKDLAQKGSDTEAPGPPKLEPRGRRNWSPGAGFLVDFSTPGRYNIFKKSKSVSVLPGFLRGQVENREPGVNPGRYRHCERGGRTHDESRSLGCFPEKAVCRLMMREPGELLKLAFLAGSFAYGVWPALCAEKRPR